MQESTHYKTFGVYPKQPGRSGKARRQDKVRTRSIDRWDKTNINAERSEGHLPRVPYHR